LKEDTNVLYVARVSGTAYEMGFALGELYGPEILANMKGMEDYGLVKLKGLLEPWGVPDFVIKKIF
jgi:hypothetical protein